jgi:hypothetical protein
MIRALTYASGWRAVFAEVPAPPGAFRGGRLVDALGLDATIRDAVNRVGEDRADALVAISDANTTTRVLPIRNSPDHSSVLAELRKELPIDADRVVVHWSIVSSAKDHQSVFVFASDRNVTGLVADAVSSAGMTPTAIDLKSLCIGRALGSSDVMILDLNPDSAQLVCLQGGLPVVSHTFTGVAAGAKGASDAMIASARSGMKYIEREQGGQAPERLVLTGSESLPEKSLAVLRQVLGVAVEPALRPASLPESVPYPAFLVCAGLLLRAA